MREVKFQFERDLHDAVLFLMIGSRRSVANGSTTSNSSSNQQMDFRISVSPKLSSGASTPGTTGSKLLQPQIKTPAVSAANYY